MMKNLDVDALQGIMDFLLKSFKKPKKEGMEEEKETEDMEDISELEEMPEEMDEEEVAEEVETRPLPGDNRKPKGMSLSITELGILKGKKKQKGKK